MNAIFLSDVHLRDSESLKTQLVIRFLQEVASRFERIYILGDLFDVWPGTNAYLVRTFRPVIQVLKKLVDDGHEVHYVEGNHDFQLGDYFIDSLRIQIHPESHVEVWGGRRILMVHGDLANPKQIGYRALRKLLRSDLFHLGLRAIPDDFVFKVALQSSKFSRNYQKRMPQSESSIRQIYRASSERLLKSGYDVVLMGHTHLPDDVTSRIEGRFCRYINIGDWVRHFTYLEFDGSEFYTKTHPLRSV